MTFLGRENPHSAEIEVDLYCLNDYPHTDVW